MWLALHQGLGRTLVEVTLSGTAEGYQPLELLYVRRKTKGQDLLYCVSHINLE